MYQSEVYVAEIDTSKVRRCLIALSAELELLESGKCGESQVVRAESHAKTVGRRLDRESFFGSMSCLWQDERW